MVYKRTTQRQNFVQPVQSAPSQGDKAMANAVGDISTLFGNIGVTKVAEEKAKFKQSEMYRAYQDAPNMYKRDDKTNNLIPLFQGPLSDMVQTFSEVPEANNLLFKLLNNTVTSSISNSIKSKSNQLFDENPLNKNLALNSIKEHFNGIQSVWKDSPSVLASVANDYELISAELSSKIDQKVLDKSLGDNAVETTENLIVSSEQLNNLAYNGDTPQNNKMAKELADKIALHIETLSINPKVTAKEISKLKNEGMIGFVESYWKGEANRTYVTGETDKNEKGELNIQTTGLDNMYALLAKIENYDGKKPLPYGMKKDDAVNAIEVQINNRNKLNDRAFKEDGRSDNNRAGIFYDEIYKATDEAQLTAITKRVLATSFNRSGTTGKLLNQINSRNGQLAKELTLHDKREKAKWDVDLALIASGKKPTHHTSIEQMRSEVTNETAPTTVWAGFIKAEIAREKLLSNQSLDSFEASINKRTRGNVNLTWSPSSLIDEIKNLEATFPNASPDLIKKRKDKLLGKMEAYTKKYENHVRVTNEFRNISNIAKNGLKLDSSNVKKLWDVYTSGEQIDLSSQNGQATYFSFLREYSHIPAIVATQWNAILQSGDKDKIIETEKIIMASKQILDTKLNSHASQERIFASFTSADQTGGTNGSVVRYMRARFADVSIDDAIELAGDKVAGGNTKLKQMSLMGLSNTSNEAETKVAIFKVIRTAVADDPNFIVNFLRNISGHGDSASWAKVKSYFEQFGDGDILAQALMDGKTGKLFYDMFLAELEKPTYGGRPSDIAEATMATAIKLQGVIGFQTTPLPKSGFKLADAGSYLNFAKDTVFGGNKIVRFVTSPITFELNKTRPSELQSIPDMKFYQEDITHAMSTMYPFQDQQGRYKDGIHTYKDVDFALKGGHIFFTANPKYGNVRGYQVFGLSKENGTFKIMDNYQPDWNISNARKSWNDIQDNGVKTALGNFSANLTLIGLPIAKQALTNMMEDSVNPGVLLTFVDWVNQTSGSMGYSGFGDYNNLGEGQKQKFRDEVQQYFNLIKAPMNLGNSSTMGAY